MLLKHIKFPSFLVLLSGCCSCCSCGWWTINYHQWTGVLGCCCCFFLVCCYYFLKYLFVSMYYTAYSKLMLLNQSGVSVFLDSISSNKLEPLRAGNSWSSWEIKVTHLDFSDTRRSCTKLESPLWSFRRYRRWKNELNQIIYAALSIWRKESEIYIKLIDSEWRLWFYTASCLIHGLCI